MQAESELMSLLALLLNTLLGGVSAISAFGFLELLHPLTYSFHQFRYLTPAEEQNHNHQDKDYFCWTDLSHSSLFLITQMYEFFNTSRHQPLNNHFLISLRISFPFAKISNARRMIIPVIWAYSRNLSLGFLPVTTSKIRNIT